jgi:ferredoxin-NADP reductase
MSNKENLLFYQEKIISKKYLSPDTVSLEISKPENFTYIPGQFIRIKVADTKENILRSYSLSSLPEEDSLKLCIKLVPDGLASNYIKNIKEGEEIKFEKAQGYFNYKTNEKENIYFIATGVGISPIFPIIKDELQNKNNQKNFKLLFGLRTKKDIFWQKELEELENKYKNFSFEIILSQEKNPDFKNGHVNDFLDNIDFNNSDFYVCGNPNMILEISKILLEKKVNIANIHFEIFE